ncbi:MAG: TatD family hydrolase [Planctomycetota bacterium]
MRLIDSHAHLFFDWFDEDRQEVLDRAREEGVTAFVHVGTDLASSRKVREVARQLEHSFPTVGVHPHDSATLDDETWAAVAEEAAFDDVVGVGETGLDFFKNYAPADVQIAAFRRHVALARDLEKPLVIHCRDAFSETAAILREFAPIRGVMHCFTGDAETAEAFLGLGLHISFAAQVTYPKKTEAIQEAARQVPLDRMLVETDCPFLPPQPFRGKRNEPSYLVHTVRRIAELRSIAPEAVAEQTARNTIELFRLPID